MQNEKNAIKKYLGWVNIIIAIIYAPFGAIISILLSIYMLKVAGYNHTIAKISLVLAIIIILIIILFSILFDYNIFDPFIA